MIYFRTSNNQVGLRHSMEDSVESRKALAELLELPFDGITIISREEYLKLLAGERHD